MSRTKTKGVNTKMLTFEEIFSLQSRIHRAFPHGTYTRSSAFAKIAGINGTQIGLKQISKEINVKYETVTNAVNHLQFQGLVERVKRNVKENHNAYRREDRKRKPTGRKNKDLGAWYTYKLTPKGKKLARELKFAYRTYPGLQEQEQE